MEQNSGKLSLIEWYVDNKKNAHDPAYKTELIEMLKNNQDKLRRDIIANVYDDISLAQISGKLLDSENVIFINVENYAQEVLEALKKEFLKK